MSLRCREIKRHTRVGLEALEESEKKEIERAILAMTKIYQHGKTSVPKSVRVILKVEKAETLIWSVGERKSVITSKG